MENRLKHGEALFAEGKIGEAKKIFDDLLKENPENHELLNNLGVISCSQNNVQEAEDYFLRAISAKKDYFNVLLNLSKLYQNTERWEQAANQLEKCISIADQNTDIFNQLGKVYLKIGDTEKAKVTLRKSLELNPDQEIVRESLSALEGDVGAPGKAVEKSPNDQELRELLNNARLQQSPRTKITVLCLPGLQSFLGDIVDFFKTKYDVRTCYSKNNQEIESAVQWADIVWLEWANEMAIHVTNNVPSVSEKQVICRIHSYEVLNGYLPRIQWSKISKTVFVADHVLKIALEL
ncbi:MAG: tetratricopeptide repeat protein, partial [Proteobacteria bacterium]|nr:tetratricopeptide repeat protein [Pseudomonadota bacterium]